MTMPEPLPLSGPDSMPIDTTLGSTAAATWDSGSSAAGSSSPATGSVSRLVATGVVVSSSSRASATRAPPVADTSIRPPAVRTAITRRPREGEGGVGENGGWGADGGTGGAGGAGGTGGGAAGPYAGPDAGRSPGTVGWTAVAAPGDAGIGFRVVSSVMERMMPTFPARRLGAPWEFPGRAADCGAACRARRASVQGTSSQLPGCGAILVP